jgi:hypothetical protein
MRSDAFAAWLLEQEARALLTRLAAIQPFVLQETCLAAAAPSPEALSGIEQHLLQGRREVHEAAESFLRWLRHEGAGAPAAEQQRRFWMLRVQFQHALAQFDLFSEVITQRSEAGSGVLLSGLDVAAAEALLLPGRPFGGPPVLCSLHRGLGGSIRRARTRLPGGGANPVALIRIPRERIIGYGVASSLVHEVGHQGAALLGLVESLKADLRSARPARRLRAAWSLWDRWVSEVVADYWAISKIGIGSTLGLIGLVSLPRGFVFRPPDEDPHPVPWLRVLLSCAIGDRMYPDGQWKRLAATWGAMYPLAGVPRELATLLRQVLATVPDFITVLTQHRSPLLAGRSLGDVLHSPFVHRRVLLERFAAWQAQPRRAVLEPPTLAFAVLGQARASGRLTPERESQVLRHLITSWAVTSTLETARATTRADTFLGQPTIWREPATAPARLRTASR